MKTWMVAGLMLGVLGSTELRAQANGDVPAREAAQAAKVAQAAQAAQGGPTEAGAPLRFEPNRGQAGTDWEFVARSGGERILFGRSGVRLGSLAIGLAGGDIEAPLEALEPLPGQVHYLLGADPTRWIQDVPTYAAVTRRSVYPGVDVVYRGAADRLDIEFVLSPAADAGRIALDVREDGVARQVAVDGVEAASPRGENGAWVLQRPVVDGEPGSARRIVFSIERPTRALGAMEAPRLAADGAHHLVLLGRADAGLTFVTRLDSSARTVLSTTYLDGFASDSPLALAVAGSGEIAIAGGGADDAVLVRLDASGRSILSRARVGGSGRDAALAVALDDSGCAWIAGSTTSADFPATKGAVQSAPAGGTDAFLAQVDPDGTVRYATLLGGQGEDEARGVALDRSGAVYLAGTTASADFAQDARIAPLGETPGGGRDAFVARIDPARGSLVYATVLGGSGDDEGVALSVTASGEAAIAGTTRSEDFPVSAGGGEPAAATAGARAFFARIDATGRPVFSATIEGSAEDRATALALDRRGVAWIAGSRGTDAFVTRLDPAAPQGAQTRVFAGASDETAGGIVIDGNGDAWVAGLTRSSGLPEVRLPESTRDGDAFVARVEGGSAPLGVCPGTKNFTGAVSLVWEDAGNWSGGTLPGAADDVCVSGFNVILISGSQNAGTLRLENGSLTVNGGTLTIAGASEINGPLTVNGGTLTGDGNVTVSDVFTWTGGTLSGAGTFTASASVTLSGSGSRSLQRTLNTSGSVTWTGTGGVALSSGINNAGTWDCQGSGTLSLVAPFNNTGTVKRTVGTGIASISVPFTNAGSVVVETGTLALGGSLTSTGSFDVAASSTLQIGTGLHSLNAGTVFTGSGIVDVANAAFVNINTAITIPAAMTFELVAGTLQGAGTLTTAGTFNWLSGTMQGAGATTCNGPLNISGAGPKFIQARTLNNNFTATWTGTGTLTIGTGGIVNNAGTFDSQNDGSLTSGAGTAPIFNNTGFLLKSAGTGTTTVSIPVNNSAGIIRVLSGTLALGGNEVNAGNIDVSAGTTLQLLSGGSLTLSAGGSFTGSGTLSSAANIIVNSGTTLPATMTVEMTGGFISGTGNLAIGGTLNWSGGTMTSAGTTTCNGPLNVLGAAAKAVNTRLLKASATTTYSGTGNLTVGSAGSILNSNTGIWDFQSDASILAVGAGTSFTNAGTFRRSTSAGTATVNPPFGNFGTVDVQTGTLSVASFTQSLGTTKLTGGTLASGANIAIQGGTLAGTGTVSGPVVVSGGALAPGLSAGTLGLGSSYTQGVSGAFQVELGGTTPGTQYDQANVTGAASLAGPLNVSLIGGFVPAPGNSFTILTYGSRTGSFTPNLPEQGCMGWQVAYGATALTLTARTVPAEVTPLTFTSKTALSWAGAPVHSGTTYDILRGGLGALPVGPGGAEESCLASGTASTTASDAAVPAAGSGFWYVVREKVVGCGSGTYGFATSGAERISTSCP